MDQPERHARQETRGCGKELTKPKLCESKAAGGLNTIDAVQHCIMVNCGSQLEHSPCALSHQA